MNLAVTRRQNRIQVQWIAAALMLATLSGCGTGVDATHELKIPEEAKPARGEAVVGSVPSGKPATAEFRETEPSNKTTSKLGDKSATMDPGVIDLLALIDPARDAVQGHWIRQGRVLVSPTDEYARLEIPAAVPEQYRITAVARRKQGNERFGFLLVAAGRQFMIVFDAQAGRATISGLGLLDGRYTSENETTRVGHTFDGDKSSRIEVSVWKAGVEARINDQQIIEWRGDFQRLSVPKGWETPHAERLAMCSSKAAYEIEELSLGVIEGTQLEGAEANTINSDIPPTLGDRGVDGNGVGDKRNRNQQPRGDGENVRLSDGTVVHMEKWGDTYDGYDYRRPLNGNDWKAMNSPEKKRIFPACDPAVETVVLLHTGYYQERIKLDVAHRRMYWYDKRGSDADGHIYGANLDGSNVEVLANVIGAIAGLAVDVKNQKIYWSVRLPHRGNEAEIRRVSPDGSDNELVVPGLDGLGAMAVDRQAGQLYFFESVVGDVYTTHLDGSGRKIVFHSPGGNYISDMVFVEIPNLLFWRGASGDRIWQARLSGTSITPVLNIGQGDQFGSLDNFGNIHGFDVDWRNQKLYWVDASYKHLRRSKIGGSQIEDIVLTIYPSSGLAIDLENGYAYWTENDLSHDGRGRVRRVKIPPLLKSSSKPAPPTIKEFAPLAARSGEQVVISGRGFRDVNRVALVAVGTGEECEARFEVRSDTELSVFVPKLPECESAEIVVQSPSGVSVTLPYDTTAISPRSHSGKYRFEDLAQRHTIWVNSVASVARVEKSLLWVCDGARVHPSPHGSNVLFIKDGGQTVAKRWNRATIYHEPFAVINEREELPADSKLIAVSAIRACFVKSLLKYRTAQ